MLPPVLAIGISSAMKVRSASSCAAAPDSPQPASGTESGSSSSLPPEPVGSPAEPPSYANVARSSSHANRPTSRSSISENSRVYTAPEVRTSDQRSPNT